MFSVAIYNGYEWGGVVLTILALSTLLHYFVSILEYVYRRKRSQGLQPKTGGVKDLAAQELRRPSTKDRANIPQEGSVGSPSITL